MCDMVVALAHTTIDGHTLFGHNSNRPEGEGQALLRTPGRAFALGETVRATHLELPQVRRTYTVLACRADGQWGYRHGVNQHTVALGLTAIRTRVGNGGPGLTGADLVRLALERAGSARQALDVITDLIGRYGQGAFPGGGPAEGEPDGGHDSAFLIADACEAYVLEACGPLLAERAGEAASVTKGTAEPVGLPASQGAVPRGLMREADTAVGPRERKPSRR